MATPDVSAFKTLLDSARQIGIVLPQKPSFDCVAAALGLKISLELSGKSVRVITPDPVTVEFNRLVGIETVADSFGSRNLVITFPGQTEFVDKVSYNLDRGELQLVITPKAEAPELDHRKLNFVSGTGRTELYLALGLRRVSDLGPLSESATDLFAATPVVSFLHRQPKDKFAASELVDLEASCLCELTTQVINAVGLKLDQDSASNLLAGIEKATNNFQNPAVSVDTFETAVILMRKGARRQFEISASQFPPGSIPVSSPALPPSGSPPAASSNLGYGTDGGNVDGSRPPGNSSKPPADWYEPKIFKGPMLP